MLYLEFADRSFLYQYLCQKNGWDLLDILLNPERLNIKKLKISDWIDIQQAVNTDENSFFEDSSLVVDWLVDIQDLEIDKKVIEFLTKISLKSNVYLYSLTNELTSTTKTLLKKSEIEYVSLNKVDESLKLDLIKKYAQKLNLNLNPSTLQALAKQAKNYSETIDILDLIDLSDDTEKAVKSLLIVEKTPLFMLSFNVQNLSKDIPNWYKNVPSDDLQFALSLVFTKLDKQNTVLAKKIQKELIQTDQTIKTRGKIEPSLWWKLFLWKAMKMG